MRVGADVSRVRHGVVRRCVEVVGRRPVRARRREQRSRGGGKVELRAGVVAEKVAGR